MVSKTEPFKSVTHGILRHISRVTGYSAGGTSPSDLSLSVVVVVVVTQLCPTLCTPIDSDHQAPPSMGFPKNTGVGCHPLLHGIFPTQGSTPGLLRCRQIPNHLSLQGSPLALSDHPLYNELFQECQR